MSGVASGAPHTHGVDPHRAPRDCPVCGDHLLTTRLGCTSCGTEISGLFASCSYCGLRGADQDMLRVFLVSRGNMKELERFLGVSYPTARQRFAELLERLGLTEGEAEAGPDAAPAPRSDPQPRTEPASRTEPGPRTELASDPTAEVLRRLAAGELGIDEAEALLR